MFLLAKSERYFYDAEAVKEESEGPGKPCGPKNDASRNDGDRCQIVRGDGRARNRRTVWTIPTRAYSGAHFATFPPELVAPCILAGSEPGGIVLDPFCGSSTVGEVCRETGRRFVGLDLSSTYLRKLALPRAERKQTAKALAALPMFGAVGAACAPVEEG